jgi:hypothetical protein
VTDESPQLEYAPRPPAMQSAKLRRGVLIAVIAALVCGTVIIAPKIINYVQLLQYQRQCLTYTASPTQVVLETAPTTTMAILVPPQWTAYYMPIGGGFQTSGTAFLHERTSPQGERLLVAVDVNIIALTPTNVAALAARIIRPGSVFRGPRAGRSATLGDGSQLRFDPTNDRLTIFAGQPDPTDASHFTIDYDQNGVRHTLDGWLIDNETVKIESRE